MDLVARQLLRALRGGRSQVAFARKLGYRGNPIADWEAGRRCPTALETLRACELSGIDVVEAFARFHRVPLTRSEHGHELAPWLDAVRGSVSATDLAERAGRSRQQVGRWLNGSTQPRLDDFLCLVDAITGRVCDLVAALVPIEKVPSLERDYRQRLAARQLAHEEPWTEAILRCIETTNYRRRERHEPRPARKHPRHRPHHRTTLPPQTRTSRRHRPPR